jgi:hypothetical protein
MGRSAFMPCPCRGTDGKVVSNSQQAVNAGQPYRSQKVVSTAQADKTAGMTAYGRSTSKSSTVNALNGMITATSIQAVASVNATATGMGANGDGSSIIGLKINGRARTVSRSERVNLPGFGYAVFNDQHKYGDGTNVRGIRVDMMKIVITEENRLHIPVGSVLTSGHAEFGYARQTNTRGAMVSAAAWGSESTAASGATNSGMPRSYPAYLACVFSGTKAASNQVSASNWPGNLTTGAIINSVRGTVTADVATATGSSRVDNVNLLNGILTADSIRGIATASIGDAGGRTSFAGSRFEGLRIMGQPIGDSITPNTKVVVPGLGTLTLYATTARRSGTEAVATVVMVLLVVTVPNAQGIPVGTQYRIARAGANATVAP